ncbi:hypothetical protein PG911_07355 [Tenacibaculum ovolyticum]|uniref:hypothetical protein n=1 Tax=Tenacibaculum ovolyticum TaxID=104270 RepID=UPI0022F38373|nr:hypothetical protein [Tenacibaculum ovolyticum]WBX78063.1 hypothetical protein PG911_07355 [Tenacibaculum ovolyticum]
MSPFITNRVAKIETFEKYPFYYKTNKEFSKSVRYFDSRGKDSLTIFKSIDGGIINKFTFEYSDNQIHKIIDSEDIKRPSIYSYSKNVVTYNISGYPTIFYEFDSKNRLVKEYRDSLSDMVYEYKYDDKNKTVELLSESKNENTISYYTLNNNLITHIKTIYLESKKVLSNNSINYNFNEQNLLIEVIIQGINSGKIIRNIITYK